MALVSCYTLLNRFFAVYDHRKHWRVNYLQCHSKCCGSNVESIWRFMSISDLHSVHSVCATSHKLQIHRIIVSFVIWPCIRNICILTDTLPLIASYQYRLNNWQNIISNVIRSLPPYPASDILHGTRHSIYIMTLFHRMMRPTDWHATDYKLSHPIPVIPVSTVLYWAADITECAGSWLYSQSPVVSWPGRGSGGQCTWSWPLAPGDCLAQPSFSPGAALDSAGVNIQTHHSSGQLIVNTASCHWQVVARTYSRMCECDYFTSEDVLLYFAM